MSREDSDTVTISRAELEKLRAAPQTPMNLEAFASIVKQLAMSPEALAAAFVAANEASEAKRALTSPLDLEIQKAQAMRRVVPGGRVGYSRRVVSKVTGATFDVEVQESRISPLGRVTGLLNYECPENWREILARSIPAFGEPTMPDSNRALQQAKYERWYRPDLRHYVGALIGTEDSGNPELLGSGEHWYIALPVEWPEAKAAE